MELVDAVSRRGESHVPSRYIQNAAKRWATDSPPPMQTIPLIDLAALQSGGQLRVMEEVGKACEEWGFFQVINHGVSASLVEKVWKVMNDFFDLPMEEKLKRPMKQNAGNAHPTGYGRLFDFSESTILDWVDALIHYFAPPSLEDLDYWPEKPKDYRETMKAYRAEMQRLAKLFSRFISQNLGLEPGYIEHALGGEDSQFVLRVNHYPSCPQPDLVMGLSPHSDGSALTFLLHDDVEGLQIRKDGQWHTVKPIPGAIIVNLGDMMQLISNGMYKSMEHRAVVGGHRDRKSIVTFYAASLESVISPAITSDQPLHYKSVNFGDYLATYMSKELEGKARIEALLVDRE